MLSKGLATATLLTTTTYGLNTYALENSNPDHQPKDVTSLPKDDEPKGFFDGLYGVFSSDKTEADDEKVDTTKAVQVTAEVAEDDEDDAESTEAPAAEADFIDDEADDTPAEVVIVFDVSDDEEAEDDESDDSDEDEA